MQKKSNYCSPIIATRTRSSCVNRVVCGTTVRRARMGLVYNEAQTSFVSKKPIGLPGTKPNQASLSQEAQSGFVFSRRSP